MVKKADREIKVMGNVNLTDDSFYEGSRTLTAEGKYVEIDFMSRVESMLGEGADILDLGACSTRPGSDSVDEDTEWRRLEPALLSLRKTFGTMPVPVSIDTFRPGIIRRAYDIFGPFIVNDISGGSEETLALVGSLGLEYIAMHSRGDSRTMQSLTDYDDVTLAVRAFFEDFANRAEVAGIKDWILDPGYGFAKTVAQNWKLLKELPELDVFGKKILVGVSRKSMIWRPLEITPSEALPGTQVANIIGLQGGADILRVHDVAEAVRTIRLYRLSEGVEAV